MEKIFWYRIACVVFAPHHGCIEWDTSGDPTDGMQVARLDECIIQGHAHWWDTMRNQFTPINVQVYEFHNGTWYKYEKKRKAFVLPVADGLPSGGKWFIRTTEQNTASPAYDPNMRIPIFLCGPTPQQYASRWNTRGITLAFDVQWPDMQKTVQGYVALPDWQHYLALKIKPELRNFYEIIPGDTAVRLFFDFDGKGAAILALPTAQVINTLLQAIVDTFAERYDQQLRLDELNVQNSTTSTKVSLHVTCGSDRFLWSSVYAMRTFAAAVRTRIPWPEAVDLSVYKKNGKFRLVDNTKRGKNAYLRCSTAPFERLLVCPTQHQAIILPDLWRREHRPLSDCPELAAFLRPFEVQRGQPHNLRWVNSVSDHLFLVPAAALDANLPGLLQSAPVAPMLHEAPLSTRDTQQYTKIPIDIDASEAISDNALLAIVEAVTATIQVSVPCVVSRGRPGRYHLTVLAKVKAPLLSALLKLLADNVRHLVKIDTAVTALRTIASDKIDKDTGLLTNAPYVFYRYYDGKQLLPYHNTCFRDALLLVGLDSLPNVDHLVPAHSLTTISSIRLSEEDLAIIRNELPDNIRITSVHTFRAGLFVSTNCRQCFDNYTHRSFTQRFYFGVHGIKRSCWDPMCAGKSQRSAYRDPQSVLSLLQKCIKVRSPLVERILQVFPEDRQLWDRALSQAWRLGDEYCGPRGCNSVDYCFKEPFCLIRRNKESGEQIIRRLPNPVSAHCDVQIGLAMLDAAEAVAKSPGYVSLQHMHMKFLNGTKVSLSEEFLASMSIAPLDLEEESARVRAQWLTLIPAERIIVDPSPADENLNYNLVPSPAEGILIVVAPHGAGKTPPQQFFNGDMFFPRIVLTKEMARRRDLAPYRSEHDMVRPAHELVAEPRKLACCINSIGKTDGRACPTVMFDESTAVLDALTVGTAKTNGPECLRLAEKTIHSAKFTILASADASPELEGAWMHEIGLLSKVRVLYKPLPRAAPSNMPCIELQSDEQMWVSYIRLLKHNSRAAPVRIFFPCNTKAAVELARHYQQRFWPAASAIFVHADSKDVPDDFFDNPNEAWRRYDLVAISPRVSVGTSFTVPNHFHVTIAFACTSTTAPWDFVQQLWRVRPFPTLCLLYRVRNHYNPATLGNFDALRKATLEALESNAAHRQIDRSHLPKDLVDAEPHFLRIMHHYLKKRDDGVRNYLQIVRHALTFRQMTIRFQLPHNLLPDEIVTDEDLVKPDHNRMRVDAILAAEPLTSAAYMTLIQKPKTKRTVTEEAQILRYIITSRYGLDGPLDFEQLVEMHVMEKLGEKLDRCAQLLHPVSQIAPSDEYDRAHRAPRDRRFRLVQRDLDREVLNLLPRFNVQWFTDNLEAVQAYRFTIADAESLLQDQENILGSKHASRAKDTNKKIIKNFNHILKACHLPTLHACKEKRPRDKETGSRRRVKGDQWCFDMTDFEVTRHYAKLGGEKQEDPPLLLRDVTIKADANAIRDNVTFTLYNRFDASRSQAVWVQNTANAETVLYSIQTQHGSPIHALQVDWEVLHRGTILRIQVPQLVSAPRSKHRRDAAAQSDDSPSSSFSDVSGTPAATCQTA
jgi:hypothetical protein